ncbi:MAG: glycine cleavage system protein H, partial [Burkholderiales bacterium]|nr:glycine cleavage system protein H [Burkholderiales bacterium]
PKVGEQVKSKEITGVVESVKAASDLYSPVTGGVVEINQEVIDDPTLINSDPHGRGWLFKVKLSDIAQLHNLMSVEEYKASIGESS